MFKFQVKVKDTHKFSKKVNDLHPFTTKINDLHSFIIKVLDTIIIKLTSIDEINKADVRIDIGKIKLLVKASFSNITQNTSTTTGKIKAKAKMSNTTDATTKLSYYQGKSKKLTLYNSTELNNMPTSLKNCCFDFANEDWGEVLTSYQTWDNVKKEVSSWNKLIN